LSLVLSAFEVGSLIILNILLLCMFLVSEATHWGGEEGKGRLRGSEGKGRFRFLADFDTFLRPVDSYIHMSSLVKIYIWNFSFIGTVAWFYDFYAMGWDIERCLTCHTQFCHRLKKWWRRPFGIAEQHSRKLWWVFCCDVSFQFSHKCRVVPRRIR